MQLEEIVQWTKKAIGLADKVQVLECGSEELSDQAVKE